MHLFSSYVYYYLSAIYIEVQVCMFKEKNYIGWFWQRIRLLRLFNKNCIEPNEHKQFLRISLSNDCAIVDAFPLILFI